MGITFDKDLLAVEQTNYLTKLVNACIVCDLDARPINPTNNFKFIYLFLFCVNKVVRNSDKEKHV